MKVTMLLPHAFYPATVMKASTLPLTLTSVAMLTTKPMYMLSNSAPSLSVDVLSLWMVIMTTWVCVLTKMTSSSELMKVLITLINVVCRVIFSVKSLLIFFILYEASLVPMLLLVVGWGYTPERASASLYLVTYTVVSGVPFIWAVLSYKSSVFCAMVSTPVSTLTNSPVPELLTLSVIIMLLVKTPIFMLHSWLPKAHVESPTVGSVLLAALFLKLGSYGMLRLMTMFKWAPLFNSLAGVVSVGGLIAVYLTMSFPDVKFMVAMSSVSHMSLSTLMTLMFTSTAISSSVLTALGHAMISSNLFFLVGHIYSEIGSRSIFVMRGHAAKSVTLFNIWIISLMLNIGLPPSIMFKAEVKLLLALTMFMKQFMFIWAASSIIMMAQSLMVIMYMSSGPKKQTPTQINMNFVLFVFSNMTPAVFLFITEFPEF